jgi:hypothetical protein
MLAVASQVLEQHRHRNVSSRRSSKDGVHSAPNGGSGPASVEPPDRKSYEKSLYRILAAVTLLGTLVVNTASDNDARVQTTRPAQGEIVPNALSDGGLAHVSSPEWHLIAPSGQSSRFGSAQGVQLSNSMPGAVALPDEAQLHSDVASPAGLIPASNEGTPPPAWFALRSRRCGVGRLLARDVCMVRMLQAAFILTAIVMAVSGARAATCDRDPAVAVEVGVREAPIILHDDLSLSDLREMSARLRRPPAHPVLGFYAGTIGYALLRMDLLSEASPTLDARPCPLLGVRAELVAVDRRIVVASDLSAAPCRRRAAIEHYQHHAAAASLALHQLASGLPGRLESEIDRYVRRHPALSQADRLDLHQYVDGLLERAVKTLSASMADIQASVDSVDEIRSLSAPCGDT